MRLRKILASHSELAEQLQQLERKYDDQLRMVFDAIQQWMSPDVVKKEQIGFKVEEEVETYL